VKSEPAFRNFIHSERRFYVTFAVDQIKMNIMAIIGDIDRIKLIAIPP